VADTPAPELPCRYDAGSIEERAAELFAEAQQNGYRIGPWQVRHDLHGRGAGEARPAQGLLRFNTRLGAANWDHFLAHVVAHEVAHLVVAWHWGRRARAHGPQWREVMALFGSPPERCHDYATDDSGSWRQRRWPYDCPCGEPHRLSTTRHNRAQSGASSYLCLQCREPLVFSGKAAD